MAFTARSAPSRPAVPRIAVAAGQPTHVADPDRFMLACTARPVSSTTIVMIANLLVPDVRLPL